MDGQKHRLLGLRPPATNFRRSAAPIAGLAHTDTHHGDPLKRTKRKSVLVVTGTRAEFGLLLPVMHAIQKNKKLALHIVATGSHLLPPARTVREVKAAFPNAITVPMQRAGKTGRLNDAAATARGIQGLTRVIARLKPDWVVVLGDRIEAFAAASAASIAGIAVCHIHGGDRAEGIADEAMRHAITKLSHLHCAATEQSRGRIVKMGERTEHVFNTGSPTIDGLRGIKPMGDRQAAKLGDPYTIVLHHPCGLSLTQEKAVIDRIIASVDEAAVGKTILSLAPNADAGREVIDTALRRRVAQRNTERRWIYRSHLPRPEFLSLLARMAQRNQGDGLIGNSSAALIECAALGLNTVNVGPRQAGRERGPNVFDVPLEKLDELEMWIGLLGPARIPQLTPDGRYGDGRAGPRIAALLAKIDPRDPALLRKRNAY